MIIQGGNEPISLEFDGDTSGIKDISVALISSGHVLKQWGMDDVEFDGCYALCNLTQEDTMHMPVGYSTIEVKWLTEDDRIWFAKKIPVMISDRGDHTFLKTEESSNVD